MKENKKKKAGSKPRPRKPTAVEAILTACPSCGASPKQPCFSMVGPMGHRRVLKEVLKFNVSAGLVAAKTLHAARFAAHAARTDKPARPTAAAPKRAPARKTDPT